MPQFTDQIGNTINLNTPPKKIISVVPSQTELLYRLGLNEEVIGITKFCIHPQEWFKTKQRIGGTKNLNIDEIKSLNPDLIIANKEENVKEQIDELSKNLPVWTSDVNDLETALEMIASIGEIINKKTEASSLLKKIDNEFASLKQQQSYTACYVIWKDPYMTIGGDTFINDMMKYAGFKNIYANKTRYPTFEIKELHELKPELVLLSSEPYPFKQKHIDELKNELPHSKIILVDGEMFSWYGSRLQFAPQYFKHLQQQINCL